MNRLSFHFKAAALAMAACLPDAGPAAPIRVASEGVDHLAVLTDWTLVKRSPPPGADANHAFASANFLRAGIGGEGFPAAQWQQWNRGLAPEGPGRFAFRCRGDATDLDGVGPDTVSVVTGILEPASWLLIAGGAGLLAFGRRRPVR